MPRLPIRKYRGFDADLDKIPEAAKARLNTFLLLVTLDPDDDSIHQLCGHDDKGRLAYPLGKGWVVYWGVKREHVHVTTVQLPRPLEVDIYAFALFDEFERVEIAEKG